MRVPKVTVIVPVFNVERYLAECLDSLSNQTYDDYEVLIVNDCSPDRSEDIIQQYVCKYPHRFRSVKTPQNGGLGKARDFGIENAKGEYVMFVDSDDVVSNKFIEIPVKVMDEHNLDMVEFDWKAFVDGAELPPPMLTQ